MTGLPIQKALPMRQHTTVEEQDKKLREAAQMYEKHFLRELVKNMRSTVPEGTLIKTSQAEKIFREQLDEQYVDKWGEKGGVGLGDMIYKQMVERFGQQMGIKPPTQHLRGPVALDKSVAPTSSSSVGFRASTDSMQKSVQLLLQDLDGQNNTVTAPWSGILTRSEKDSNGDMLLGIDHQNGFQSLLRFSGTSLPNMGQGPVLAGQPLGTWNSANSDLRWQVDFRPATKSE